MNCPLVVTEALIDAVKSGHCPTFGHWKCSPVGESLVSDSVLSWCLQASGPDGDTSLKQQNICHCSPYLRPLYKQNSDRLHCKFCCRELVNCLRRSSRRTRQTDTWTMILASSSPTCMSRLSSKTSACIWRREICWRWLDPLVLERSACRHD